MGRQVWDASQRRDHTSARRYFDQAIVAARTIRNPAAEGLALYSSTQFGRMAGSCYLFLSDPGRAVVLLEDTAAQLGTALDPWP
jgi:hypothetical protein